MQITDEQKKRDQQVFTAIWEVYKRYRNPEDDEKYWDDLIKEFNGLSDKYNCYLATRLARAVIDVLADRHKEDKQ